MKKVGRFLLVCLISLCIFIIYAQTSGRFDQNEIAKKDAELELNSASSEYVANQENESKTFYYNQLDETGKKMYLEIINNTDKLQKGEKFTLDISEPDAQNRFQKVWDAIILERPEIFYLETENVNLSIVQLKFPLGKVLKSEYTIEPKNGTTYLTDYFEANKDSLQTKINQVEQYGEYIQGLTKNKNEYGKIMAVHDFLVDNLEYNYADNNVNNRNIYGALVEKSAVCEGYAKAFKYLMDKINIPCVVFYGTAKSSDGTVDNHAWNAVKLSNGKWYFVDTTWDDPYVVGGGRAPSSAKYRYFLVGSDELYKDHTPTGDISETGNEFTYPEVSKTNYR